MTYSGFDYPCSAGETFDSVALSIYGDEKYAADLLCMNPDLATTPVFIGGELLKLPVVEVPETGEEDSMPFTPPWKDGEE